MLDTGCLLPACRSVVFPRLSARVVNAASSSWDLPNSLSRIRKKGLIIPDEFASTTEMHHMAKANTLRLHGVNLILHQGATDHGM